MKKVGVFGSQCILVALVRVCVCLSLAAFVHYCTDPDLTLGELQGSPLVVHYWAELQSLHGFRCYGNMSA